MDGPIFQILCVKKRQQDTQYLTNWRNLAAANIVLKKRNFKVRDFEAGRDSEQLKTLVGQNWTAKIAINPDIFWKILGT